MMRRTITVAVVIVALVAVALLAGCPKPQTAELQGAPTAAAPPPATHTMPGGEQMKGAMPPATSTEPAKPAEARPAAGDTASCPVLGTTMVKKDMIPYAYKGKTYYLCCADCVAQFKANPDKFIKHPAKPLPLGAPMPTS
jgi:YHS domain-containing protein